MQKVAESPMAAQMSSQEGANILHSHLTSGAITLMGSDMIGVRLQKGNAINLCLYCSSDEEINILFDKLSAGGQATMPPHQSFWGSTYGKLTDKYGITWLLNYVKN